MDAEGELVGALTELQRLVRRPSDPSAADEARWFAVDGEEESPDHRAIGLLGDEVGAAQEVLELLQAELRFEHLANPKAEVQRFIARCMGERETDHVDSFVVEHAKAPVEETCFIHVTGLIVKQDVEAFGIRLLPPDAPELPVAAGPPIQAVAAITVSGTNHQAMADRARARAEHSLRLLRLAIRADRWIHDWQLRFRLGAAFLFPSGVSGWAAPGDTSWELELGQELLTTAQSQPISSLPADPETNLDRQADLAVRWIEAAYFSPDAVMAALDLFFALEAILGRKSEREKGHGLAFRRAILGAVISGRFAHPNRIYLLYDKLRSAAVHGEIPPPISSDTLQKLAWDVRVALNECLQYANDHGITTRKGLLRQLDRHQKREKVLTWLRENGGPDWSGYLETLG